MKLLQRKPDAMNDTDWAFALRWSAQEMLAGSAGHDDVLALSCLFKSYELGDTQAGWELALYAIERGLHNEIIDRLIRYAALHGSIDAAWWMRDNPCDTADIDWQQQAELNFHNHAAARLAPPSADDCAALRQYLAVPAPPPPTGDG